MKKDFKVELLDAMNRPVKTFYVFAKGLTTAHREALKKWRKKKTYHLSRLPPQVSDEMIEEKYGSVNVIMEQGLTYGEIRQANYYRRQGAKWMREQLTKQQ